MIRITDKSFRYTASFDTDLRKKFRKIERERRAAAASRTVCEVATTNSVVPIVRGAGFQVPEVTLSMRDLKK